LLIAHRKYEKQVPVINTEPHPNKIIDVYNGFPIMKNILTIRAIDLLHNKIARQYLTLLSS